MKAASDICGVTTTNDNNTCNGCYTHYCSIACQIKGFKTHKCENSLEQLVNHPPKENSCSYCDKGNCKLKCGLLCGVYYCDKNCQREDWPYHKSLCDIEESKRTINTSILSNFIASGGVYIITPDDYRHFTIEDFVKYAGNHKGMSDHTNKILILGDKLTNKPRAKITGKITGKNTRAINRTINTMCDYTNYINNIGDYGLSFKPTSFGKWKNRILTFNILDNTNIHSGFLKIKNVVLMIKEGNIEGSPEEITFVSSTINQRFIKSFDDVFEYMEKNPKSDYVIDVLEISPKTGIYGQYHHIVDLTNDITFIRGKMFIVPVD